MASLRRKPDAEAVVVPPVAVEVDHSPSPDSASDVLKAQLGALRTAEELQQQHAAAIQAAEGRRREWLEATPAAKAYQAALNPLHHAAIDAGLVDCSPAYFDFMSQQLAALQAQRPAANTHLVEDMQRHAAPREEPPQPERRVPVSAPVSRQVPDALGRRERGRVTLSVAEQEHARLAGISVEEYAKQKLRMETMKAAGEYGGDQR